MGGESYLFHCVSEAVVKKGWDEAFHAPMEVEVGTGHTETYGCG